MNKEQLREEWKDVAGLLVLTKARPEEDILVLQTKLIADWWLSKLDTYTQSLVEKVEGAKLDITKSIKGQDDEFIQESIAKDITSYNQGLSAAITILKDTK